MMYFQVENDVCSVCRENGGDIVTCDICLTSSHRQCADPRVEEESRVPDGSPWICQKCTVRCITFS